MTECFIEQKYYLPPPKPTPKPSPAPIDPAVPPAKSFGFHIQVFDLYTLQTHAYIHQTEENPKPAASALVCAGYVGAMPLNPSIAFDLKTLEHYHRIRLWQPSFSIQAFMKVLCDTYMVSPVE